VFQSEGKSLGFVIWTNNNFHVYIDNFIINKKFRKKGIGSEFYKLISEHFKQLGFKAIRLFCSPIESKTFWEKQNFIEYPKRGYGDDLLPMYYTQLIECLKPVESAEDNKIELWDLEPNEITDQKPRWTWPIEKGKLKLPIITPFNHRWQLRITINNKVVKDGKIKHISDSNNIVEQGYFLYITKLNFKNTHHNKV
jgi:predicted GNAT family acetyltransferase